jgi:phage-related protein
VNLPGWMVGVDRTVRVPRNAKQFHRCDREFGCGDARQAGWRAEKELASAREVYSVTWRGQRFPSFPSSRKNCRGTVRGGASAPKLSVYCGPIN